MDEHAPMDGRVPILILHSVFGLRPVELAAAERLRRAGHPVRVPDLFDGAVAEGPDGPTHEGGFAIQERIGWDLIMARAEAAARELPPETVLLGFSMGAGGVIANLWPTRLGAAAVLLLHSTCEVPPGVPPGTPVQTHVAEGDPFASVDRLTLFTESAARAGAAAACYTYPDAGHYYTDPSLADHNAAATALTWRRVEALLRTLPTPAN